MDGRLAAAERALADGRLVVYPTDTLPGLGASATDRRAVARLERVKGRSGQPLSIAVGSPDELEAWTRTTPSARRWIRRHLPGPFTVLLEPSTASVRWLPRSVVPTHGALAVRVPDHPVARELARRVGPLVATSANRHGEPPCRTVGAARRSFGSDVAMYLPFVPAPSGRPSTFVDLRVDPPRPWVRS